MYQQNYRKQVYNDMKLIDSTMSMSGRPGFDSRPSQNKDFKLVVEAPLSNDRHIKGSSTPKLVDPLPE